MTTTDQNVSNLIINKLTKAQYEGATKSDTELYLTTDELISSSDVTTALGYTPADNDLSNLSNAGEEKLGSFIKYELAPQSDGFETVWNEAHSTFDSSKFTVVGGSTITDAGLVTDTAVWDKYVQIPINKLDVTSPFEVNFRVIKNTFTSNNQLIGGGSSSSNITIYASGSRYGDCCVRVYDSNTAQSSEVRVVSSWDDVQAIPDDTSVDVNISWDGTNYYYKVTNVSNGTVYANTSATSDLPLDTINYNNIIGNFVTSSGCYFDLKNTYIIQGGVIVFSANITGTDTYTIDNATVSIPYTLSTKDDKYVDSYYRDSVNKLLVSQCYTPYYTIDEVNKNFTIPTGKLYKLAKTISTKVDGYPKHYIVNGHIMNTSADSSLKGYGTATVILYPSGIAEVHFGCKVETSGTNTTGWASGINRDLLHNLDSNIPVITPITGGVIYMYKSNGSMNTDLCGYGGMSIANGQFWTIARVYQTDGAVGGYPSSTLTAGMMFYGTLYGTYTVGTEG